MSISASGTDSVKEALRLHLARYDEQGDSEVIGTLQQLQTVVKITDSPVVDAAVKQRNCPQLGPRQYLVACVNDGDSVKVRGVYLNSQIYALEAARSYMQSMEWKLLEIPEALENELRRKIGDKEPQPSCSCSLL